MNDNSGKRPNLWPGKGGTGGYAHPERRSAKQIPRRANDRRGNGSGYGPKPLQS